MIKIIIPCRCFSCGKPVAHLWEEFRRRLGNKEDMRKILDTLALKRYCCRALFMGHIDLMEQISRFKRG